MFTFGKNAPEKPTFSKNTLILDYLVRMEKDLDSYRAMCIFIHKLQSQKMRTMQRQELIGKQAAGVFLAAYHKKAVQYGRGTGKDSRRRSAGRYSE